MSGDPPLGVVAANVPGTSDHFHTAARWPAKTALHRGDNVAILHRVSFPALPFGNSDD